jgi:hypothetical protein
MSWEAAVKKSEVCVLLPPGPRAERPEFRFDNDAGVAGHVDDDRTLHPEETTAQRKCATPLAQTHQCNVRVCETISCDHSEIVRMLDLTPSLQYTVIAALSPIVLRAAPCAPACGGARVARASVLRPRRADPSSHVHHRLDSADDNPSWSARSVLLCRGTQLFSAREAHTTSARIAIRTLTRPCAHECGLLDLSLP